MLDLDSLKHPETEDFGVGVQEVSLDYFWRRLEFLHSWRDLEVSSNDSPQDEVLHSVWESNQGAECFSDSFARLVSQTQNHE